MSRNGSGTYNLPAGNPVVTATTITSTWANTTLSDIATALTGSLAADGQTAATGNLNMNTNQIKNVVDPTLAQDAATKAYVDAGSSAYLLKASNLSDVANATTSRTNLSAAKSGANSDITSITGLTTPLAVSQGGIGAATLTANNVLLGNGTSAPQVVAPGTSGNVLTSNGTSWVSTTLPAATTPQLRTVTFASSGSWTAPTGVTKIFAAVVGAGGGGGQSSGSDDGGYGGYGGIAIGELTVTPGTSYTITIGAGGSGNNGGTGGTGGTTSLGALMSATGGVGGPSGTGVGSNGNGTSGTVKNGFITNILFFSGSSYRPRGDGASGLAWSINSAYIPGGGGTGEDISSGGNNASGGIGGAVVIQYVGA